MVVAPGSEGYLGILPPHAPLFTTLGPGEFRVKKGGIEQALAVFGGFMDVRGDRVVVLTEAAENAEEIDSGRAQEARDSAQRALAPGPASAAEEDPARARPPRGLCSLRVNGARARVGGTRPRPD